MTMPESARGRFDKLGSNVTEVNPENVAGTVASRWLKLSPEELERSGVMAPRHESRQGIDADIRERLSRECRIAGTILQTQRLVSKGYANAEKALKEGLEAVSDERISTLKGVIASVLPERDRKDGMASPYRERAVPAGFAPPPPERELEPSSFRDKALETEPPARDRALRWIWSYSGAPAAATFICSDLRWKDRSRRVSLALGVGAQRSIAVS